MKFFIIKLVTTYNILKAKAEDIIVPPGPGANRELSKVPREKNEAENRLIAIMNKGASKLSMSDK